MKEQDSIEGGDGVRPGFPRTVNEKQGWIKTKKSFQYSEFRSLKVCNYFTATY